MKSILFAALLALGLTVYGEGKKAETKPTTQASAATTTTGNAPYDSAKTNAKEQCLKENPKLMGAELDACVKAKEKSVK
ncbi:MAG: hypothetical protein NZ480_05480 [Bdellovibrionaceae bacterium]|nr:hypothetical protein [Pseudobdellovibrionaceae bacterium]MDW8190364.1 hypothetical protein [Pseudobdellovibrionaceae bacterium]